MTQYESEREGYEANYTKTSGTDDAVWGTANSYDVSAREDSRSVLHREESPANLLHLR